MPKYQAENHVNHCRTEGYERLQPRILAVATPTPHRTSPYPLHILTVDP